MSEELYDTDRLCELAGVERPAFTNDQLDEIEAALSPKQKKVVNFLFGQCMKADPTMRAVDPKMLRCTIISRLSVLTYEEEDV
jgi:hypothetical protein